VRRLWNDEFLSELENFPAGKHDDAIDALSGAYKQIGGRGAPFEFERVNISRPGDCLGTPTGAASRQRRCSGDRHKMKPEPRVEGCVESLPV
jgi:hypothetical protein